MGGVGTFFGKSHMRVGIVSLAAAGGLGASGPRASWTRRGRLGGTAIHSASRDEKTALERALLVFCFVCCKLLQQHAQRTIVFFNTHQPRACARQPCRSTPRPHQRAGAQDRQRLDQAAQEHIFHHDFAQQHSCSSCSATTATGSARARSLTSSPRARCCAGLKPAPAHRAPRSTARHACCPQATGKDRVCGMTAYTAIRPPMWHRTRQGMDL